MHSMSYMLRLTRRRNINACVPWELNCWSWVQTFKSLASMPLVWHATAYQDSFKAGRKIESPVTTRLADGMACRIPDEESLEIVLREADDVIAVTDDEVAAAMQLLFKATHNVAEGAGAASLRWLALCSSVQSGRARRLAPRYAGAMWIPMYL